MPFRNLKLVSSSLPWEAASEDDPPESRAPKPPTCPNCKLPMSWYNSRLQRQNGSQKIVHSFVCPNCAMVIETDEPHKQALRLV